MKKILRCPRCGYPIEKFRNPTPTVDIIIEAPTPSGENGIVLIERKNFPYGWALPGGFVDYGERVEDAAVREALEETSLNVRLKKLLGVYSDPRRDPRRHTVSVVFIAEANGLPQARGDAKGIGVFTREQLPQPLAFDHAEILADYFEKRDSYP